MRPTIARLTTAAAAAAAVLAVAAPGAQASCTAKLIAGPAYDVRLCGIPDFDQQRIAATGVGAAQYSFTGLPYGGAYSCAPTALTNLLAFYGRRGLTTRPGDYPWEARVFAEQSEPPNLATYNTAGYSPNERAAYEAVTSVIDLINPKIDASGSNYGTLPKQLDAVLAQFSKDVTFTYATDTFGADAPQQIASAIANGATVLVGGEAFESGAVGADGVRDLGPRAGGHAMTVRGIKGKGSSAVIFLRDPGLDESTAGFSEGYNGDRLRQSRFMTQVGSLRRAQVRFPQQSLEGGAGGTKTPATQTTWAYGGEVVQGGVKRRRYLTSWLALYPQTLVFKSSKGFSVVGRLVNLGSTARAAAARPVAVKAFDVGPVADATFVPQSSEVVFVRRDGRVVEAVNVVTRARRVLGRAPSGTRDLETDARRGEVLVLGSGTLLRLPVTRGEAAVARTARGFDALAFDVHGDRVALVSARSRTVRLFSGASLTARRAGTLPASALAGEGRLITAFDDAGRLLLRRAEGTTLQRAVLGSTITMLEPTTVRGSGLVVDDRGTVLTTSAGRIQPVDRPEAEVEYRDLKTGGVLVSLIHSAAAIPDLVYAEQLNDTFKNSLTGQPSKGFIGTESLPDETADAAQDALTF